MVGVIGTLPLLWARAADAPRSAGGASWPMFGGTPSRNMVNLVDKDLPAEGSIEKGQEKNIKWVAQLGNRAYGGPVVAGGKVFVGTNNANPRNPRDSVKGEPVDKSIVMCFRELDGKFLWQAVHDKLPDRMRHDNPEEGIASTPAVDGKRVYYLSNRCELICADTEGFLDGKNDGVQDEEYKDKTDADIVWRLDLRKDLGVSPHLLAASSPLVVGDLVYVLTSNGVELGEDHKARVANPKAPSLIAVNKHTGKLVWQDNSPGADILEGQWSNPTYAEVNGTGQVIYGGGDGWLRGFEARTGKPIWKFDCNPKSAVWRVGGSGTRSHIVATPVVHDNKVYVGVGVNPDEGSGGEGHLWCVDITKTGDLSPVGDNFDPAAAVNKNSGLVWHYGGAIVPRPKSGRDNVFGRTISTCAIHDGLLYVAEVAGYLHCLDAATGKPYWVHDLKAGVWGSPYWVDGKVYLGSDTGDLLVFAHGKEKKLLGKVDMDEPVLGTPVAANGVLYVATKSKLYAIAKK
jgi:outer membrane protein assembly factor BamB